MRIRLRYHDLTGIGGDRSGPGYKQIIIKKSPVGDIVWARASLNSVRGTITSDWKRDGGTFTLKVQIPPNTTATITIPTSDPGSIQEDGVPTLQRKDLRPLPSTPAAAVFEVPSGTYLFSAKQ